jgi:hypothetical protein
MSEFKVDLNKLKAEIDRSKNELASKEIAMGRVPENAVAKGKRGFLNELVSSMHHGGNSTAIEAIRAVNETVESRRGVPQAVAKNNQNNQPRQQRQQYVPVNENVAPQPKTGADDWGVPGITTGRGGNGGYQPNMGGGYGGGGYGDRGDELFEQNIARQMAEYDRMKMQGNPVTARAMQNIQQGQQYPQQMNEQIIVEQPNDGRNMEKLVESAFKNVLTDIYTKERIQESLIELLQTDEGLKIVGRAINEIAKRNKAKAGK